jgi:hypothetical protein
MGAKCSRVRSCASRQKPLVYTKERHCPAPLSQENGNPCTHNIAPKEPKKIEFYRILQKCRDEGNGEAWISPSGLSAIQAAIS